MSCTTFIGVGSVDARWRESIFISLPPMPSEHMIKASKPVVMTTACSLLVPNGLLYKWHMAKLRPYSLVHQVNLHIIAGALALDTLSTRLKDHFMNLVKKIGTEANEKQGANKEKFLQGHSIVNVDETEVIPVIRVQNVRGQGKHKNQEEPSPPSEKPAGQKVEAETQTDEGIPETEKELYKMCAQANRREELMRRCTIKLQDEISSLKRQLKDAMSNADPLESFMELFQGGKPQDDTTQQTLTIKLKKLKARISEHTWFLKSYGLELRKVEMVTLPAHNVITVNWEHGEADKFIHDLRKQLDEKAISSNGNMVPSATVKAWKENEEELKEGEVQLENANKKPLVLGFNTASKFEQLNEDQKQQVFELLHILDKYGITGECYHDLVMTEVGKNLPKSYLIKQAYAFLNSRFKIKFTPGQNAGAQQSFTAVLTEEIKEYIKENKTCKKVEVKVVGYGTPVSRSTHVVLLGFTLIDKVRPMISASSGFRTIAGFNGPETYQNITEEFTQVIEEINNVVKAGKINIAGKDIEVEMFLSGDYKFLTSVLGLKSSENYCIYCKMNKDHRQDASKPKDHYTVSARKRTLADARQLSKTNKYGMKHPPLLDIEFDHVLIDDFCVLSQVMDILIDNVINDCISLDEESKEKDSEEHTQKLVEAIHKAGIGFFQIWKAGDKWQWTTPLAASQKRTLLEKLPTSFPKVLRPKTGTKVARLWREFKFIMGALSSDKVTGDELYDKSKKWLEEFVSLGKVNKLEGYEPDRVTMYMHMLPYHLPIFKDKYGNLKPYTGHGVEVSNNAVKMSFFRRGNRNNPITDMIQWENRQWLTEVLMGKRRSLMKRAANAVFGSPSSTSTPAKRVCVEEKKPTPPPSLTMETSMEEAPSETTPAAAADTEDTQPPVLEAATSDSQPPEAPPVLEAATPSTSSQSTRATRASRRATSSSSNDGPKPWIKLEPGQDNSSKMKLFKELGAPDSDEETPVEAGKEISEYSYFSEGQEKDEGGKEAEDKSVGEKVEEEAPPGPVVEAMNAVLFPSETSGIDTADLPAGDQLAQEEVAMETTTTEVSEVQTTETSQHKGTETTQAQETISSAAENTENTVLSQDSGIQDAPAEMDVAAMETAEVQEDAVATVAMEETTETAAAEGEGESSAVNTDAADKQKSPGKLTPDPKLILSGLKKVFAKK